MSKKKPSQLCINCQYCDMAQYATNPKVKWHVCKHTYFKDMFLEGRTLDLDEEPLAPWCPKPAAAEPRPSSNLEILPTTSEKSIKTGFGEFEKAVIVGTSDNSLTVVGGTISNDKDVKDGREREVEVSSEDGIFGKSPW
jgi:hypothetical protein